MVTIGIAISKLRFELLLFFITLLATILFSSLSNTPNSMNSITLLVFTNFILLLSICYSHNRLQFHKSKFASCLAFALESKTYGNQSVFCLTKFGLFLIIASAVISILIVTFSSTAWNATYFFAILPIFYLFHLLNFYNYPLGATGERVKMIFYLTYILFIIIGVTLLFLANTDLDDGDNIAKCAVVLAVFGSLFVITLYYRIFKYSIVKLSASFVNVLFFIAAASMYVKGSRETDLDLMNVSVLLAVFIPMSLLISNIYIRVNVSSEVKNSIFLCIMTAIFIPSMSLAADIYLNQSSTFGILLYMHFIAFTIYCLLMDTSIRLLGMKHRELVMFLPLGFLLLPCSYFTSYASIGQLTGYQCIILCCAFLAFFIILYAFYGLRMIIGSLFKLDTFEDILKFENKYIVTTSVIWKMIYLTGITFINAKLYYRDFTTSKSDQWLLSQGLAILISAMLHSSLLEIIVFFVKEIDHHYCSLRRITLISKMIPSSIQTYQTKYKTTCQIYVFVVFVVIEVISLFCLIASINMVFMIVFNFVIAFFTIVGLEVKYKVWSHGDETIQQFLLFLWTCIYFPLICGISILMTETESSAIQGSESLLISFIIICFCLQLGWLSGKLYYKLSNFNYIHMRNLLKAKNKNECELIIEDIKNNHKENQQIVINNFLKDDFLVAYMENQGNTYCHQCNQGKAHEIEEYYYQYEHLDFLMILLLTPTVDSVLRRVKPSLVSPDKEMKEIKGPENEKINQQIEESKIEPQSAPEPPRMQISQQVVISYKELFKIDDSGIIRSNNFTKVLSEVYREQISKKKVTRDDFFYILILINRDIRKRVSQKFNDKYVREILKGLARLIYGNQREDTLEKVNNDLLVRNIPIVPEEPEPAEAPVEESIEIPEILARKIEKLEPIAKQYLFARLLVENQMDKVVPFAALKLPEIDKNLNIVESLNFLRNLEEEFEGEVVENSDLTLQYLFFASILNVYTLSGVALSAEINWLTTNLSLATGVIPAQSSWLASQIISFFLIGMLFAVTITLVVFINQKSLTTNKNKFIKAFVAMVASGMIIENFTLLLGNFMCDYTAGVGYHAQFDKSKKCFGPEHLPLFVISGFCFIVYFLLVNIFYPSFYKIVTKGESYYNIEIHCKLVYSAICGCVSENFIGFKLFLCSILVLSLTIYSMLRVKQGKCDVAKFNSNIKEYLVVLWIYFWAILIINGVLPTFGFIILIITIVVTTIKGFYKIFKYYFILIKNCIVARMNRTAPALQSPHSNKIEEIELV